VRTPEALRQELTLRSLLISDDVGAALKVAAGNAGAAARSIGCGTEDVGSAIKGAAAAAAHNIGEQAVSASDAAKELATRTRGAASLAIRRAKDAGTLRQHPGPKQELEVSDPTEGA